MAAIVGRLALSHAPQLIMPPDKWQDLPYHTDHVPHERPELEADLGEEVKAARFQRCADALDVLRRQVDEWSPDAIVVIGDDQHENILNDNMPPFVIYTAEEVDATLRFRYLGAPEESQMTRYAVHSGLAGALVEGLMEEGFDPAWSRETRMKGGLGHAFGRPLHFLTPNADYPIVPLMVNTYFPPAPSPKRCVQLGQALARVVAGYDGAERVVIMGSGGLSHVRIDEELDEAFMKAVTDHDLDYMATMPAGELTEGTSEIRNWIATAATADAPGRIVDYVPCYRTIHGIGCAMGFAVWES